MRCVEKGRWGGGGSLTTSTVSPKDKGAWQSPPQSPTARPLTHTLPSSLPPNQPPSHPPSHPPSRPPSHPNHPSLPPTHRPDRRLCERQVVDPGDVVPPLSAPLGATLPKKKQRRKWKQTMVHSGNVCCVGSDVQRMRCKVPSSTSVQARWGVTDREDQEVNSLRPSRDPYDAQRERFGSRT